jgi:hypothetical protein
LLALIDLSRPPARRGPRLPGWAIFTFVLVLPLVVLIVVFLLLPTRGLGTIWVLLIALAGLVDATVIRLYARRFLKGRPSWSAAGSSTGYLDSESEDGERAPDNEERAAWKAFRRGQMDRTQYERIVARRRFVHGDISREEYHEIVKGLGQQPPEAPPR